MRQTYIDINILEEFYGEDMKSYVISSVTKYCCQQVSEEILLL